MQWLRHIMVLLRVHNISWTYDVAFMCTTNVASYLVAVAIVYLLPLL